MAQIDFRLLWIADQFLMLRDSIRMLEEHLPTIFEKEARHAVTQFSPTRDDAAIGFVYAELKTGIVTRSLTGAPLIAAWAIYESEIKKIARSIQEYRAAPSGFPDQGGSFVKRARKYFRRDLTFELHPKDTDWNRLEVTAKIRHCLAHANGGLRALRNPKDRRCIWHFVRDRDERDLEIEGEWLIVTLPFARSTVNFIEELIRELAERARREFPKGND